MPRASYIWKRLDLPGVVAPAAVRAGLVGLAGLPGQPRLVLETVSTGGRLAWRLGGEPAAVTRAVAVLRTHLPELRTRTAGSVFADVDQIGTAGNLRIRGSRHLPLGTEQTEPVVRAVLDALMATRQQETLRLQLILGPRTTPRRAIEIDGISRTLTTRKAGQHGFGCALRVATRAETEPRARHLVSQVAAGLRGLEIPGVSISLGRVGVRSVAEVGSPLLWPLWLSVDDLVPLLGWPVSDNPEASLPGMPPHHPKLLPATSAHPGAGRPLGLATTALAEGAKRPVAIGDDDTLRHVHVMGPTGVGKSVLLAHGILADIATGKGVVVIDPKRDLVTDLLARIPAERAQDVIVLDAADAAPVGINALAGGDPDLAADSLLAVFHSLFSSSWGPRTSDILHASLLTLARRGDASLVMVPLLLTNPGFRRSVVGRVAKADPLGLGAFWAGFEAMTDGEREQAIRPMLNKLRQVLLRPSLRAVFGQREPRFRLEQVFTERKILLVALGKDRIGPEAAQLLGSIVVAQLWQAILGRASVPASQRRPVSVVIDEAQDYLRLPGSLADTLTQARGLGVGFTIAHQHRAQLGSLLPDIDANTRSKLFFSLSPKDARDVARAQGDGVLAAADFTALPAFHAYGRILSGNQVTPWVSLTTEPLGTPVRDPAELQTLSRDQYGQTLDAVEQDLLGLISGPERHGPDATADRDAPLGRVRPGTGDQR